MASQPAEGNASSSRYLVVARRYRPQSFADLVGQQSAARALGNAIATQRIGHAYLFTGARGVGKTSTARIFAKALNCVQGPTAEPCQVCEMCLGIADGNDVDVLEIDGASNRGIDEIRQLRSSIGVRPSRARFKVYIIDEVHMLTREAFNALLKTLEEPPAHVKFVFCTTSPEKIPITVLSRCQRFDFPPVELTQIIGRLAEIVAQEGATAEPAALELLAKRAAGSMRDSQSLLEQVLAFCGSQVTTASVHQMMGTASSQRLLDMLDSLTNRDAAGVLSALDNAVHEGVDAGQLAEQLLGYLRDTLALAVGGQVELLLHSSQQDVVRLRDLAQSWGIENLLAAAQIIDQSIVRMRQSLHGRTLLELALVRVARLEQLDSLPELLQQLQSLQDSRPSARPVGPPSPTATPTASQSIANPPIPVPQAEVKKKSDVPPESLASHDARNGDVVPPAVPAAEIDWNPTVATRAWLEALDQLPGITAEFARRFESIAAFPPNRLVVVFPARYNANKSFCERPERRQELEAGVQKACGIAVRIEFQLSTNPQPATPVTTEPRVSARQAAIDIEKHRLVKKSMELFRAEITSVELPRNRD